MDKESTGIEVIGMTRHTASDQIDYTLANYLIDGLIANTYEDIGPTTIFKVPDSEGSGFRVVIEVGGRRVEHTSRLSWFAAAEMAVRQVVWLLKSHEDYEGCFGGSHKEAS